MLASAPYFQHHCVFQAEPRRNRGCGSSWYWHADTEWAAPGRVQATEKAEEPTWRRTHQCIQESSFETDFLSLTVHVHGLTADILKLTRCFRSMVKWRVERKSKQAEDANASCYITQIYAGIKASMGLFWVGESGLLLPEARVLLQTGRYDFLILLAVNGAGGVDQALQPREPEAVVQTPQLEGGQGGQTSLNLLLVGRGGVIPETHHTWTPHTDYRNYVLILICSYIDVINWKPLLQQ